MKTVPEAIELAQAMVEIGEGMGRRVKALITRWTARWDATSAMPSRS